MNNNRSKSEKQISYDSNESSIIMSSQEHNQNRNTQIISSNESNETIKLGKFDQPDQSTSNTADLGKWIASDRSKSTSSSKRSRSIWKVARNAWTLAYQTANRDKFAEENGRAQMAHRRLAPFAATGGQASKYLLTTPWIYRKHVRTVITYIILINAAIIGLSSYFDSPGNHNPFIAFTVLKYLFTACYLVELILRIIAEKTKFLFSTANMFEFFLLVISLADVIVSTVSAELKTYWDDPNFNYVIAILNVIQLLRLGRVFHMFRSFYLISRGMAHALKALAWTAIFAFAVLYGCSVFATMTWGLIPTNPAMNERYGTLHRSLYTMFQILTIEGWNDIAQETREVFPWSTLFFVVLVCFAALMLMNVITGIILDSFSNVYTKHRAFINYTSDLINTQFHARLLANAFNQEGLLLDAVKNPTSSLPSFFSNHTNNQYNVNANNSHLFGINTKTRPTYMHAYQHIKQVVGSSAQSLSIDNQVEEDKEILTQLVHRTLDLSIDPLDIIMRPTIIDALQNCEISVFEAFDALTLYIDAGALSLSVLDFTEACKKVQAEMTGRQFLLFELRLDLRISELLTKLDQFEH